MSPPPHLSDLPDRLRYLEVYVPPYSLNPSIPEKRPSARSKHLGSARRQGIHPLALSGKLERAAAPPGLFLKVVVRKPYRLQQGEKVLGMMQAAIEGLSVVLFLCDHSLLI